MSKTIDLTRLEALARAATPGPWRWGDWSCFYGSRENLGGVLRLERNPTHPGPEPYVRQRGDGATSVLLLEERPDNEANAEYVAAASPDVVLELIRMLREASSVATAAAVAYVRGRDLDPTDANSLDAALEMIEHGYWKQDRSGS
jgi:hypothetical protein